ncbi:unnamed protein product [Trifolium pratense]|uniref:Uncharacterized protein n=1 Tax=Trifolium pratense TaxID=57577 RepID=A0ACB0M4U8_TRIPR|nr:unnamed protein product [Trifolium pratense]
MAHRNNFFMAILMVVLLFSVGMHKTEAECIGPCYSSDVGSVASCKKACENRGHRSYTCTNDHKCCCTDIKINL